MGREEEPGKTLRGDGAERDVIREVRSATDEVETPLEIGNRAKLHLALFAF